MLPPASTEILDALAHTATTPLRLGAANLTDAELIRIAAHEDWIIVTENARDFASASSCAVLLVRKSWLPLGSLALDLASALDRWALANPAPGPWAHVLEADLR